MKSREVKILNLISEFKADGGRFLKEEGPEWVEVSHEKELVNKIHRMIRHQKSTK